MKTGRKPDVARSEAQKHHAAKERQRYQSLPKEKRQEIVQTRDRQAQQEADARRHERDKPKRLAKQKDWQKRTWEEQAPKRKARAVAQLKGKASACAKCGSTRNLEAHHPDHSKPSRIVTLCAKCHGGETSKEQQS